MKKNVEAVYTLSPTQEGMLFQSILHQQSLYIEQFVTTLDGELNLETLRSAWGLLMQHHSILRTAFAWRDRVAPLQVVASTLEPSVIYQDWQAESEEQQQQNLADYLQADEEQGFHLSRLPLHRTALFQTTKTSHIMVWTCHHILIDGWSYNILMKELLAIYAALQQEKAPELPLTRPYRDYVMWLKQQDTQVLQAFWQAHLSSIHQPTLPGIAQPEPLQHIPASEISGEASITLPSNLSTRLQHHCRQCHITMNTLMQGVWAAFLSQYNQKRDVSFGVTLSGRPTELTNIESTIGPFIHTLPLHLLVNDTAPFWTWLEHVQQQQQEVSEHQYVSLSDIYRWSKWPSSQALFDSMINFEGQELNHTAFSVPGLRAVIDTAHSAGSRTHYALTILIGIADEVSLTTLFDQRHFLATDIQQLLQHWHTLLSHVIDHPYTTVEEALATISSETLPRFYPLPTATQPDRAEQQEEEQKHTELEEIVASVWSQVLGIEHIPLNVNVFTLGGHSLLVTQVAARLREIFGVELPLKSVFEANTIAKLAETIHKQRTENKAAILEPITPAVSRDKLPLSFAQQRLWFLDRLFPNNPLYNVSCAQKLSGLLNREALEESINSIIARHEVLRTAFTEEEGQPAQVILSTLRFSLSSISLASEHGAKTADLLQELIEQEVKKTFELASPPLLRASLISLNPQEHILLLVIHHILADGWSLDIFFDELSILYAAYNQNKPCPLPSLPIQYADIAAWQYTAPQEDVFVQQLVYWRKQLAQAPTTLNLPTDHPRPLTFHYTGSRYQVRVTKPQAAQFKALCQSEGVTLFMGLLGTFAILLTRMSEEDDLMIGSPMAGRTRREMEPLIGLFINTLVLRIDMHGQPSFRELLQRVRSCCLDAYEYQEVPFERVVEAIQPERDLGRNPLFQVMFALQQEQVSSSTYSQMNTETLDIENHTAKFDISLFCTEEKNGEINAVFEYSTELFEETTIAQMSHCWLKLLTSSMTSPDMPMQKLPWLTAQQQQTAIRQWKGISSRPTTGNNGHLHELIAEQALRTPKAIALCEGEQVITYAELIHQATHIAHRLQSKGVGPEVRVAICLPRSFKLVSTLLGILLAGGCYVPLDPTYPQERLHMMLQDARPSLLITEQTLPWEYEQGIELLQLKELISEGNNDLDTTPLDVTLAPTNQAALFYTSGSTGRPKGVITLHGGITNFVTALIQQHNLNSDDVVLQLASLSFDASIRDLLAPLVVGARVVLIPDQEHNELSSLHTAMIEQNVTCILSIVPSFLDVFLAHVSEYGKQPIKLRLLLVSGEALHTKTVEQALQIFGPQTQIINLYGPSECTMTTTAHPVVPAEQIPLGHPIPNSYLLMLDAQQEIVPPGIIGEVYIGGADLTRGYHNQPGLTAERFIPDPHSSKYGARLYRTGDLARVNYHGDLDFVGRTDQQIKLHGIRIEPEEIEIALLIHPDIAEAIVLPWKDQNNDINLCAYIVRNKVSQLSTEIIRLYLSEHLPQSMVPAYYTWLSALPRTPNGKIDRHQLPEPQLGHAAEKDLALQAPRDMLELRMIQIWEQVLQVRSLGITSNFFACGGHSLKAVVLVEQIQQQLGVRIPLTELYRSPVISHLCDVIRSGSHNQSATNLVALQSGEDKTTPLFLIHPQSGEAISYFPLVQALPGSMTIYGLQAVGYDDDEPALETVTAMAERYLADIQTQQPHGPYRLAGWSLGGNIAFEIARTLETRGEKVEFLGMLDARAFGESSLDDWYTQKSELVRFGLMAGIEESELQDVDEEIGLDRLLNHAKDHQLLPTAERTETMRRMMKVFTANGHAADTYRYQGPVEGNIHLFKTTERHPTLPNPPVDAENWRKRTKGDLFVHPVPGNHHTFVAPPHVLTLAESIQNVLQNLSKVQPTYA